jgi:hypothetical protein
MSGSIALPVRHQELANQIWRELIAACEAYFARHEGSWLGDTRAPEFGDEAVTKQFEHWDGYRRDHGAMHWRDNGTRPFAYDMTLLPMAWKRAVCERVWVLCREAKLDEDDQYAAAAKAFAERESSTEAA